MKRRFPSFLQPMLILLVLVVGPLHAQTVFACTMMDTVMLDECCCEGHAALKDCVDSDCDAAFEPGDDVCCDRSVEVSIDTAARQDMAAVSVAQVHSDTDPPHAIPATFKVPILSRSMEATGLFHSNPIASQSGTDIYLTTQRQRI